ncbi:MAG: DUF493 domain-containing protein [Calditrichaeota bacterium]|nr:MAG: DUF493 domain-containing protein [Calditrichota bacterium]MBL1204650.1 DUF493 domain-containing protein [Calditrichota bacterium]NOG44478.1 DUF493 domain-containing protein [Calditrichota bacterium]
MNKKIEDAKIEYPCTWDYKVIGSNYKNVENAIKSILSEKKYTSKKSNMSSKGTYVSVSVSLVVENEDIRNKIFNDLKQHENIKMVL